MPDKKGLKGSTQAKLEATPPEPAKKAITGAMQQREAVIEARIPETDRVIDFFIDIKVGKKLCSLPIGLPPGRCLTFLLKNPHIIHFQFSGKADLAWVTTPGPNG